MPHAYGPTYARFSPMRMIRRGVWPCCILMIAVLAPAAASGQTERVLGCYDLYLGTWAPNDPGGDSIYYAPPTRVLLTADSGAGLGHTPRGYALLAAPSAMPSLHQYSWWTFSGDSILMHWSSGFSGVNLRLAGGDTLRGVARTFSDVVPGPRFTAEVVAPRVECTAPITEIGRRLAYRLSPVVRLESGDSLVLDGTVDSTLVASRLAPGSLVVRGRALAPYDGAARLEVVTRQDGTVWSIRMRYPSGVGFDRLLSQLTQSLGSPTSGPRMVPRPSATWSSRLLYISLSENLTSNDAGLVVSVTSQRRW